MPATQIQGSEFTSSSTNFNTKRSESLPRISNSRSCKLYRTPPTPPLERQSDLEKSFKLDCIAVSNISLDYTRANPKLGAVIPPYNSLNDNSISDFVKNYGVREYLKRNDKAENEHESIAGKVYDDFFNRGAGYKYLSLRNQFGNGRHPETVDGHQRYMAEQPRVMISYNNMNGYRRNIPKLRCEPPSTFSLDPQVYERVRRTYKSNMSEDEILEHFKNTYMIGYPFHDNNFNHFHPSVKYVITVKTGLQSLERFKGNLGINIVSRNFDTGFIKLDENILLDSKKPGAKRDKSDRKILFKQNQQDIFEFEDQDIRSISAIILSRDGKGDELLYLDFVEVEIQKPYEKQTFRFPFDGWLRKAKQDSKTEQLKQRFGKKNSIIAYPNEVPKFEYGIRISPQITKNTEYSIEIDYAIKKLDASINYRVEFSSDLPVYGKLLMRLNGSFGRSDVLRFNHKTQPIDREENDLLFKVNTKDCGELTNVSVMYEETEGRARDIQLTTFKVVNADGHVYEFEINQVIKSNKEHVVRARLISNETDEDDEEEDEFMSDKGKLEIQLVGQAESTGQFELKNHVDAEFGIRKYVKKEANIGNIKSIRLRYEGKKGYFASVKSVHITSNKNQEFSFVKNIAIKNYEEIVLRDNSKTGSASKVEPEINRQMYVQIFGDRKRSEMFQLKNATSSDDTLDTFTTIQHDLGKITNVFIKYEDVSESRIQVDYVEIIDPRGNSYRFRAEANLKGGQTLMLPRKAGAIKDDGSTTGDTGYTETEGGLTTETESEPERKSTAKGGRDVEGIAEEIDDAN